MLIFLKVKVSNEQNSKSDFIGYVISQIDHQKLKVIKDNNLVHILDKVYSITFEILKLKILTLEELEIYQHAFEFAGTEFRNTTNLDILNCIFCQPLYDRGSELISEIFDTKNDSSLEYYFKDKYLDELDGIYLEYDKLSEYVNFLEFWLSSIHYHKIQEKMDILGDKNLNEIVGTYLNVNPYYSDRYDTEYLHFYFFDKQYPSMEEEGSLRNLDELEFAIADDNRYHNLTKYMKQKGYTTVCIRTIYDQL